LFLFLALKERPSSATKCASIATQISRASFHPARTRAFTFPTRRAASPAAANRATGRAACTSRLEAGERLIVNPGREPAACLQCHVEVHAQFRLPQHHPVLEGRMNCVQCHDPHGADIFKASHRTALGVRANSGIARLNETCAECHREQARPVIYEHEALREGCTICHHPHGAIADKMLVQRDNNLCLKCHAQVHAGEWRPVYRRCAPHHVREPGRLLERRVPHRRARVEHRSGAETLRSDGEYQCDTSAG
jgi:predicted CXXCH cytochrome family protein